MAEGREGHSGPCKEGTLPSTEGWKDFKDVFRGRRGEKSSWAEGIESLSERGSDGDLRK